MQIGRKHEDRAMGCRRVGGLCPAAAMMAVVMMAVVMMGRPVGAGVIGRTDFGPDAVTQTYDGITSDQISPMTVGDHRHEIESSPALSFKFKFPGIDLGDLVQPNFYVLGAGAVFQIVLDGGPYQRVGIDVGHPQTAGQTVEFYGPDDQLLYRHHFLVAGGSVFVGYELTGGSIAKLRFIDDNNDTYSAWYDNLTVEQITSAGSIAGDFNVDSQVEQIDLNLLLGHWGAAEVPAEWSAPFDGLVDQTELNDLLGHWGAGVGGAGPAGGAAVPEPATVALAVLVGLAVMARRSGLRAIGRLGR